ncbi:hypothetical protein C5E45_00505 [Nocardia nova]|uniref:DUF3558 domain-containing protein n=1 Tax=Nocardia nova TaxID=37330 RepID=A0A2S6AWT6_9NOCA|nr:DUF3558 family protein [Nocardia nova]PPJ28362.1 hypothetical protein C5E41_13725 [Nocardia nova]PPJ39681.1 hypothetical protein C5E45_00505 [Nocardia nova]
MALLQADIDELQKLAGTMTVAVNPKPTPETVRYPSVLQVGKDGQQDFRDKLNKPSARGGQFLDSAILDGDNRTYDDEYGRTVAADRVPSARKFSFRRSLVGLGLVVGAIAASGCESGDHDGLPKSALPTTLPSSFDPCKDIPADVLASLELVSEGRSIPPRIGGVGEQYKGCEFRTKDGYAPRRGSSTYIQATNMTMDYFTRNFAPEHQFNSFDIAGRKVATSSYTGLPCVLFISLKEGGVEVGPLSVAERDSCQVLTEVATAIIPHIPQNA